MTMVTPCDSFSDFLQSLLPLPSAFGPKLAKVTSLASVETEECYIIQNNYFSLSDTVSKS